MEEADIADVTSQRVLEDLGRIQTKLLDLDDIRLRIGRVESASPDFRAHWAS
jgi:hypothetical protein